MTSVEGIKDRPRTRQRSDALRNRGRLLDAAGKVLRTQPGDASMPLIAAEAGLSVATAYRYYSSIDELLNAYLHSVVMALRNFSHDCPRTGRPLFTAVASEWVRLLGTYGAGMIQLRSRAGFLQRLYQHDEVISTVRDAWERPIRSVMRDLDVPDDEFDYALFLYNVLFDPREVLDLLQSGLTESALLDRLTSAYFGALRGWAGLAAQR